MRTADAAQWHARSWTTDDALPQGTMHAILQTRDGYLWFSTYGGLVRFDGLRFHVFERATTHGIASNRFTTLFEDHSGTLWAGTDDGFITAMRNGSFQSHRAGDGPNEICAITETAGAIWALSREGFFVFERDRFVARVPASLGKEPFKTPFGYGYHQGFAYATQSTVEIIRPEFRRSIAADHPSAVYTDQRGIVWFAERDAIVRVTSDGTQRILTNVGSITAMLAASDGSLWLAVPGKGVARVSGSDVAWVAKADGLSSTQIVTLFEDREGTIWTGSAENGISCIRPRIATVWDELPSPNLYPVIAVRSGLLVGSWGSGVFRFTNGRFEHVGNSHGPVMSVLEEPDGTLWWSEYGRGVMSSRDENRFLSTGEGLPSSIVPVLYRDRSGRIWAGTDSGLAVLSGERFVPVATTASAAWREIHVVAENPEGDLLVGTRAGIGRLRNDRFEILADERSGLASGNVRAIQSDADGTLWAGTYDGGISRIRNGRVVSITTREGLYDNGVFSILADDAFFWMSSNRGIYRVSRAELNAVADGALRSLSALAITRRDGLKNAECNGGVQSAGCRTADGHLWFPTQAGLVMIDPHLLRQASTVPDVQLMRATADGRDLSTAAPLRIRGGGKRIELSFASLTFVDAERTRYRYMLEGLDRAWTQTVGERTVSYTGLPPGHYRFVVTAANAAGSWNPRAAALNIDVLPPFWRTWWFFALVSVAMIIATTTLFRRRLLALEARRAAQAEFSRRLLVQQEEERRRVAAELHDSLGQNLLVIKNRAMLAAEGDATQIEEISATASAAIDEVRRIAHNLRPAELDHLGVTKAIEALVRRTGTASNILFAAGVDPIDGLLSKESEVNLFRIVQEWMSNVVRHSGATAAVLNIAYEAPRLSVRFHDDGIGLRQDRASGGRIGMGMRSIAERAQLLGATCEIVSREGEGTTMTMHVDARAAR
jgi:signal transduction histidine kinase/ligand-binding sensor domain-containing protein